MASLIANLAWSVFAGLVVGGFVYVGFGLRLRNPFLQFLFMLSVEVLSLFSMSYLLFGDNVPGDGATQSSMIPAQVLIVVAWVFAFRHKKRQAIAGQRSPSTFSATP